MIDIDSLLIIFSKYKMTYDEKYKTLYISKPMLYKDFLKLKKYVSYIRDKVENIEIESC